MYRVLRKNPSSLTAKWRWDLRCWLAHRPVLRELCAAREAIVSLYRVRGPRAGQQGPDAPHRHPGALVGPGAQNATNHPHALAQRGPGHFLCRLTNARTEGFNGKAKLVIRRAYGYKKSFRNYRLRLLSCCA